MRPARLPALQRSHAVAVLLLLVLFGTSVRQTTAQVGDDHAPPKHEFRAAWIATVLRLDWPQSGTTQAQQAELVTILDRLEDAGINAVFFQVRSETDAMYESEIEPWSYWLTGEQGRAPQPYYDPLQFAIEEAHKRGMELHAWFNPYRSVRGSGYAQSPDHVSVMHPEWTLQFGNLTVLNPGLPDVREYVTSVVLDVVERYDIDGVHFDDYFYPYPPDQITNQDQETFQEHNPTGIGSIGDWRRNNVDLLVQMVHEGIEAIKPGVKFGISPFGIWKNGVPAGIVGLDAYSVIYADAVKWLDDQWIDYLTPQLYWPFGGGQDYARLAPWWAEQTSRNDRHLYPGHGLYRADAATFSGTLFAPDEVPRQVRFNREHPDISGSVFFRARNISHLSSRGFADTLKADLHRYPALTPIMDWHSLEVPPSPGLLSFEWTGDEEVTLSWTAPAPAKASEAEARFFAVYRVRSASEPAFADLMDDARNLLALTGETMLTDRPGIAEEPYYYVVASVSANSIESEPSNVISIEGRATSVEVPERHLLTLDQNYPNPFRRRTEIGFRLEAAGSVRLRVYDALGRLVDTVLDGAHLAPGFHTVQWNGTDLSGRPLAAGTYFYALEVAGARVARAMVLVP